MAYDDEFTYRRPHEPLPPYAYRRRPPTANPWTKALALLVLVGLVLGAVFLVRQYKVRREAAELSKGVPREVTPRGDLAEFEKSNIAIYKKARPSVVHITSLTRQSDALSLNVQDVPWGTGSGIIWDKDGHVVTNFHVITREQGGQYELVDAAKVVLADEQKFDAQLVGAAPDYDLAVLKISAPREVLLPIEVGQSSNLQVGQMAYAIGNPFGLDQTFTMGVVSALGREIKSPTGHAIKDVIQTDTAINPGNSGGPLLDSAARLIGVNAAIYSRSGGNAGIGFAIPVDEVNRIVPQLIQSGKVTRPTLGIVSAPDDQVRRLGLDGLPVVEVKPGSPAAKAGLRGGRSFDNEGHFTGDVIKAIDGKRIRNRSDLVDNLERHKPGDTITLTIQRVDQTTEVQVTLGDPG
jgi:S1-C subfamily serine protease